MANATSLLGKAGGWSTLPNVETWAREAAHGPALGSPRGVIVHDGLEAELAVELFDADGSMMHIVQGDALGPPGTVECERKDRRMPRHPWVCEKCIAATEQLQNVRRGLL